MRIIHISDLHFGMHNKLIVESFLQDLSHLKPDIIIISGDLTQRAKFTQYQLVKEFIQQLSCIVLVVPGNHDIPLYAPYSRLLHPFKLFKDHISSNLSSHFSNDKVRILGVNSATPFKIKDGHLSEATLKRIQETFSNPSDTLNILFFHHNLHYFEGMHHPLENAEEFIRYLTNSTIHLVCTGHLHYASLNLIPKANNQKGVILHAGSLCCLRSNDKKNSYYLIDTEDLKVTINWRVYTNHSFVSEKTQSFNFK